jgi:RNA polymerase-binding protein DksA
VAKHAAKKPSAAAKRPAKSSKKPVKPPVASKKTAVAQKKPKPVAKIVKAAKPAKVVKKPAPAVVVVKRSAHPAEREINHKKSKLSKSGGRSRAAVEAPQLKPEGEPLPDRVATNLKPRKNQAGLSVKELEYFRDKLLEKRREIVGDMSSMEREALRSGGTSNLSTLPIHMADMGTDNYEQEFTLGLVEKDRNLLREINNALAKIQNGTYGICEGTGKVIPKARLEVQPWARFGVEYQTRMEKGTMGVR